MTAKVEAARSAGLQVSWRRDIGTDHGVLAIDGHPDHIIGCQCSRSGSRADALRLDVCVRVTFDRISGLVRADIQAFSGLMQTLPISKVKDRLNELVDAPSTTHEQVTITKNGSPAAVLIGMDEWESLQETLFWLSQPGIRESVSEATADAAAGRVHTEEKIRAEFNVPARDR